MAFDKSLDKELFKESIDLPYGELIVSVFSYNDGAPKLQLSRKVANQETGDITWGKLGRLTKDEIIYQASFAYKNRH